MIKPDCYLNIGKIIARIQSEGFMINKLKMFKFTPELAAEFYGEHQGKPFYPNLVDFMTSDLCVGMELVRENAIKHWRTLLGPTNTQVAKEQAPNSIRAQYGTDGTKNACHGSDSKPSAKRELDLVFGQARSPALLNNCAGAIIKPHAVKSG